MQKWPKNISNNAGFSNSRTGIQPTMWKIAHVVPVHKKASRSTIKNYRPVSLLSICSKVMEDIVNHQLVNYLEKYQLLSNRQFGFRRGLGTADLLTALQHQWVCTVGEGGCVQVLAVDIAGAFDKVSHPGLLWKLQRAGVQGKALRWLHDYLNQRRLKVVVGGKCSQPHFIKAGVPQGSILGPTLFLMYVNDAETCLAPGTQMAVYADDTTLYSLVRSTDTIQQQATSLQESLDALHAWGLKWRVSFEPSKSQYLSVSNRIDPWPHPCPTFGGTSVSREKSLKLLGVTFDSRLSFSEHLRQVSLRANSRLGFLRKASKYLDTAGKLATYRGFIRPLLEYAHLAWIGAAKSHLQQLDRVQRRALHILGPGIVLQSLEARRMVGALTYLYKLMCPESPRMLTSLVPPLQPPPTCPRTRQDQEFSQRHQHQLRDELPASAPNFLRRSFPFCAIAEWNSLQPSLLDRAPALKHMQSFKSNVHKLLRQRKWVWATDSLWFPLSQSTFHFINFISPGHIFFVAFEFIYPLQPLSLLSHFYICLSPCRSPAQVVWSVFLVGANRVHRLRDLWSDESSVFSPPQLLKCSAHLLAVLLIIFSWICGIQVKKKKKKKKKSGGWQIFLNGWRPATR